MRAGTLVQATSRRRPSSAASRATRSRLRSAHRPEERSSRSLFTARCSASGPTLVHTDTARRTCSSRYASGRRQCASKKPSAQSHGISTGSALPPIAWVRSASEGQSTRRPVDEKVSEFRQVVAREPEPLKPPGATGVVCEHHHAAGHAPHLAQARDRVLPVMHRTEGHRGVEGPVLERETLRSGGHARRRARRTLRPHDRRRFHRGDIAVGGLVGAGSGSDVQHRPCVPERVPDPCGDPRLGTPRRRVSGPDGVVQLRAQHFQLFLRRRPDSHGPCLQFCVDGRHHGSSTVALFQQQTAQSAQVRDRIGGRVVDQIRDLAQSEAQPAVGEHLPQPLHVDRRVGPVPGRGPRGRPHEADLVIVMQRADAHSGQFGHAPHGQVFLHTTDNAV